MSEQPGWHHPGIFRQSGGLPTSQPPAGHQRLVSNSAPGRGSAPDLGRSRDGWCATALQTPPTLPLFSFLCPHGGHPMGTASRPCSCADRLAQTREMELPVKVLPPLYRKFLTASSTWSLVEYALRSHSVRGSLLYWDSPGEGKSYRHHASQGKLQEEIHFGKAASGLPWEDDTK